MKYCNKCKIWKNEIEFCKDKSRKDGLYIWCKECVKRYRQGIRKRLSEKNNIYAKTVKGKYTHYKSNAKIHNRIFDLSLEQFRDIVSKFCVYCGKPSIKGELNGIDRVDNSKGYVAGNCLPCCKWCNRMKLTYGKEEFEKHLYRMSIFNNYKPKWAKNE